MFGINNIHPMIVHFPIALILAGFFADIISLFFKKEKWLRKTGLYLMVLGTFSAIIAYISGNFFTEHPEQGEILKIFELHETGALITIIIMLIGLIIRIVSVEKKIEDTNIKWVIFLIGLLGTIAVSLTGYWGGSMVYDYMIGI
jgi:uncharacterized membrane protein